LKLVRPPRKKGKGRYENRIARHIPVKSRKSSDVKDLGRPIPEARKEENRRASTGRLEELMGGTGKKDWEKRAALHKFPSFCLRRVRM